MHQNLAYHLHTEECNVLIRQLFECHDQNKFGKFFGVCNDIDNQVNKCLKKERVARRQNNYLNSAAARLKAKNSKTE